MSGKKLNQYKRDQEDVNWLLIKKKWNQIVYSAKNGRKNKSEQVNKRAAELELDAV